MTPQSTPSSCDSPCVKICTLNAHGICIGCGRELDEIANWSRMTVEQQRMICEKAAARRRQIAVDIVCKR